MSLQEEPAPTEKNLFGFLSASQSNQTIINALRDYSADGTALNDIMEQYQLPGPIKEILQAYRRNRANVPYLDPTALSSIKNPAALDNAYREHYRQVADLLRPIKGACAGEIDRIWDELGLC
jgi:hypothetical protein